MASSSIKRELRSTETRESGEELRPPIETLPTAKRNLSVERRAGDIGSYHFLDTQPTVSRKIIFNEFPDTLYAIVACSVATTGNFPVKTNWNCPVLTTWLSKEGTAVLIPRNEPDFANAKESAIVEVVFPQKTKNWVEYHLVAACNVKGKEKFMYKNPCNYTVFIESLRKLRSTKKWSDSEDQSSLLSSESARILIPAAIRGKKPVPPLKPHMYKVAEPGAEVVNKDQIEDGKNQLFSIFNDKLLCFCADCCLIFPLVFCNHRKSKAKLLTIIEPLKFWFFEAKLIK
jgi:hypothetical protein